MKGFFLLGSRMQVQEKGMALLNDYSRNIGFDAEIVPVSDISVISQNDFDGNIYLKGVKTACPDLVIVGNGSVNKNYQLNAVLRMFESLGVLCINPASAIMKTTDKLYTNQICEQYVPEIKVPKTMLLSATSNAEHIVSVLGLPLVLKVMHGSGGRGVTLIHTEKELENMLSMLFASAYDDQIIAQEAILSSKGRDLRMEIMGDEVVSTFVRCNDSDFRSNTHQGGHFEEYDAPQFLMDGAVKLFKKIGLIRGSIDFLFGENGDYYFCEANSANGINHLANSGEGGNTELADKTRRLFADMIKNHPKPYWK